jgi:hypothetical protein
MSNIVIPPEALYAFQKAWANNDTLSTAECLTAMLQAWPGMKHYQIQVPDDLSDDIRYTLKTVGILLPLQETSNDQG